MDTDCVPILFAAASLPSFQKNHGLGSNGPNLLIRLGLIFGFLDIPVFCSSSKLSAVRVTTGGQYQRRSSNLWYYLQDRTLYRVNTLQ